MKVVVEGGNQEVIDKLNGLGHADLEIVTEGGDLTLDAQAQELILQLEDTDALNKLLMELIMAQHSDKFFKLDSVKPMKLNTNAIKKRRAKNKMARGSRQVNRRFAKSRKKSNA